MFLLIKVHDVHEAILCSHESYHVSPGRQIIVSHPSHSILGFFNCVLQVAVVWRRQPEQLQYDFLENGWPLDDDDLRQSRRKLHRLVDWFLSGSAVLPLSVDLPGELVDEYGDVSPIFLFNHRLVLR